MLVSNNAREALRHAQGNLAAAEAALQAARATTSRARAMLEEIVREGERLEADGRRAADALADKIRGAIEAGASPPVGDMSKSADRSDLDARRTMVERIVADFATAEHVAELALSGATAVVERAVQDVLRSEVETIASRWAKADREARALRIKLGRESEPIWRLSGLSDAAHEALVANARDADFRLEESRLIREPWEYFAAALVRDPDARLDFTAADRAIDEMRQERLERRIADERFIARMRGEAA